MEKTEIKDTKKLLAVSKSMLDDSTFEMCKLERLYFNDVNMSGTRIVNANLSDLEIEGAQLGGAWIHNIGLPPEGHPFYQPGVKQRPLKFEDCYLAGTEIINCNLSNVSISDCNVTGMTINGISVEELLKSYQK
jgi:uncharacterized protein YjbI with pentapeptide repeats